MDENMGGIDEDTYYLDEPLKPWEMWLNRNEFIVFPTMFITSLLFMFWLTR